MKLKTVVKSVSIVVLTVLLFSSVFNYVQTDLKTGNQLYKHRVDIESYHRLLNISAPSASYLNVPENGFIFIKTHKTASSTLSGILWQELCERQGFNCFLPPFDHPGRTWDFENTADMEYIRNNKGSIGKGAPFDVWLHHARMHPTLHSIMKMPHPKANKFASIVRHPAHRFRSAWTWYELSAWFYPKSIRLDMIGLNYALGAFSLETFVHLYPLAPFPDKSGDTHHHSTLYDRTLVGRISSTLRRIGGKYVHFVAQRFKYRTGLDATSEELVGLRTHDPGFKSGFKQLLLDVLSGKVLLLVTDRFDESLLVVRGLLSLAQCDANHTYSPVTSNNSGCSSGDTNTSRADVNRSHPWYGNHTLNAPNNCTIPLSHLLYLRQKQQSIPEPLSSSATLKLQQMQPYDTLLYKAANNMLDHHISLLYGSNRSVVFKAELRWLKEELTQVNQYCAQVGLPTASISNANSTDTDLSLLHSSPSITTHTVNSPPAEGHNPHPHPAPTTATATATITHTPALCARLRRDNKDLVQQAWRKEIAAQNVNV